MKDSIIVDDLTEPFQEVISKETVDKVKIDQSNAKILHGTIYREIENVKNVGNKTKSIEVV